MMFTRILFYVIVVCVVCGPALADIYSIDPRAAFLRTNQDTPVNATVFLLSDLSLFPGDFIRLQQLGDFKAGTIYSDVSKGMAAVFSSSNVLLSSDQLHRVPGAIDAGIDYNSGATYFGSLDTNIPEDFAVNDTTVQIPQGAAYLFIGTPDSLYYDNSDPDSDYAVSITRCTCPAGDLDSDCTVKLSDFGILASQWLGVPGDISADIYPQPGGDGFVDILDLLVLAENWLGTIQCE